MNTQGILLASLLPLAGSGLAFAGAAPAPAAPRVAVVFVQPGKFTDCKRSSWGDTSPELLNDFQQFLQTTAARYVPADMHLEIKVTDIDLAGEFEPQLGPQFDDIRMIRAVYPPRIALEFSLTDAKGAVVRSGQRELTDLAYQMRIAWPEDDYLRYEKDILRDWCNTEFRNLKTG